MFEFLTKIQNQNLNITPTDRTSFKGNPDIFVPAGTNYRKDSFNTNPLYTDFTTKEELEKIVNTSPQIQQILKENKIPNRINLSALEELKKGHLMESRILAAKIYSALPNDLKEQINLMDLQQATMLHDIGKILIPEKILNKNGPLTQDEKQIMDLHSTLGYEILKQKGIKPEVLELVKYHHQTPLGDGYPVIENDFEYSAGLQVLQAADKYSALTENRSYKPALSKNEALKILYEESDKGNIAPEIYEALAKVV